MRKVTNKIAAAFNAKTSLTVGKTRTDGETVWLHGNAIVQRRSDGVYATLAGWNTPTTRELVNGITGARFSQKDFGAYLNGVAVDPSAWIKVG